ncbi:MAG: DUF4222 domain-containing protein [Serratia bockelmannii]
MKKKNPGLIASGSAQPEINQGDKWNDSRGGIVIIESYRFNRVTFIREGYSSSCVQPVQCFIDEFKPAVESKNDR